MTHFHISLLSRGSEGKSRFLQHFVPVGSANCSLTLSTSQGPVQLRIQTDNGLPDNVSELSAVLLFFSVNDPQSFQYAQQIYATLRGYRPNLPLFVVGGKCDLPIHPYIQHELSTWEGISSCLISASSGANLLEPFQILLRQLLHNPALTVSGNQRVDG